MEDPLNHGSGLGLWVMQWAAIRSGGTLTKTDRDPTGTVVTFELSKTVASTHPGPRDAPAERGEAAPAPLPEEGRR